MNLFGEKKEDTGLGVRKRKESKKENLIWDQEIAIKRQYKFR